jgi:V/A-type H+-transporting ATPase subunit I
MLTPVPMRFVTLSLLRQDVSKAGLALAEFAGFAPQSNAESSKQLPEALGKEYIQLFQSAHGRLTKIMRHLQLKPAVDDAMEHKVISKQELAELDQWLGDIWVQCSACDENSHNYKEQLAEVLQQDKALENFLSLDVDLGLLHGDLQFLHILPGTMPPQHIVRLQEALGIIGYTLSQFSNKGDTVHVIVAGLKENRDKLDSVLKAAAFHPLDLPGEFRDHPQKVRQALDNRRQKIFAEQAHLQQKINSKREQHAQQLQTAAEQLVSASSFVQFGNALKGRGDLAQVTGWVPESKLGELQQQLEQILPGHFLLQERAPTPDERAQVPSDIPHGRLLRPFAGLVKNYGIPRYGELDPTWLFALTFIAMFGMMFGDVGHGLLIALSGVLLRNKIQGIAPFMVLAGLSSTSFGFLYGSIFGYENVLPALWLSPLSDPILMLKLAFAWGVGFILLATLITIRNNLVENRYGEALFDNKGVAGLLLYIGMLFAGYRWITTHSFGWLEQIGLLLPLLTILVYKWQHIEAPLGERILVVAIEGFESLMSYVSNTLSFLRVAAFSLNHVALAVAVFTLADMMGSTGHWITVVLGNLFILVLEGGIVIIQVLRLEYFEGFSRFFRGDGQEFRPMCLSSKQVFARNRER